MKLTKQERAAQEMCAYFERNNGGSVNVEWCRSKMWGMNPHVIGLGGAIAGSASGCGYNKLSAAVASALRFLGRTDEERNAIHGTSGAGVSETARVLRGIGWELVTTHSGKMFDGYMLHRIQ